MNAMLPADIQAALDQMEPAFAAAWENAIAQVVSQSAVAQIEDAIRAGAYAQAYELLRINAPIQALQGPLLQAYWAGGGLVAGPVAGMKDPYTGQTIVLGFNGFQPRAIAWAERAAAKLVTAIVDDQRTGIQAFITGSVEAGKGPRAVALDIVGRIDRATGKRTGGIVGLTGQQMQWVLNARAELSDPATAEAFIKRLARNPKFDLMIAKAAKDGKALAAADVDKIVQDYSSRLLKKRGEAIARTEALNALRAGQWEGWLQAIESGKVSADRLSVRWNATPDKFTRHSHMALGGQKVKFGQPFVTELGSRMRFPGDQEYAPAAADVIQCRCSFTVEIAARG